MNQKWTGERMETFVFSGLTFEHLHRYAFAKSFVAAKTVLDIACGEGYGSNLLAETAKSVIGIDIDKLTIVSAQKKYIKENLSFETGTVINIPFADETFDIIVSFETIEHIDQHAQMLGEIKRVLKKNGLLIISTPEKKYFSDIHPHKNPFHAKELYKKDFKDLLFKYFRHVNFLRQNSINGSLLITETLSEFDFFTGNFEKVVSLTPEAMYWIAIASNNFLPVTYSSCFFNEEIYHQIMYKEIEAIKKTLAYRLGYFLLAPLKQLRSIFGKQ